MRRFFSVLLCAALASGSVGCGSDNDDVLTVVPPLAVRSIFPSSGVTGFVGEEALSVTFDRPAPTGSLTMALYPAPAHLGTYGPTGSGRNWAWQGAAFTAEDGAYAWMIDGFEMVQPVVIHFASGDREVLVGFDGIVQSQNPTTVPPQGTMLFALPDDAGFNPLDPATFLEARPRALSAAVAIDPDPVLDGPAEHRFPFLQYGRGYIVVGVKDTNNDLVYDPTTDWWGYYRSSTSLAAEIVFAVALFDSTYNGQVDIFLQPPVAR